MFQNFFYWAQGFRNIFATGTAIDRAGVHCCAVVSYPWGGKSGYHYFTHEIGFWRYDLR